MTDDLEQHDDVAGEVLDLHQRLDALADAVAAVMDEIERIEGLGVGRTGPAPCWSELPPGELQRAWAELYVWVRDVLLGRYRLSAEELRPCWYRHPAAVEELNWLHRAWDAAYRDPSASVLAAAEWHDRWLPGVLDRLRRHVRCRDVHDPIRDGGERPVVDDPAALQHHVATEVARRSGPT